MKHYKLTFAISIFLLYGCASDPSPLEGEPLAQLVESFGYEEQCPVKERNFDGDKVQATFDKSRPALLDLYKEYLQNQPSLRGLIYLHLTLARTGAVSDVEVLRTTVDNTQLVKSASNFVRDLKFPATSSTKSREFCYPIKFYPE